MNRSRIFLALGLLAVPWLAHASCESTKDAIAEKIRNNGVKHFALKVVPAGEADKTGGKVVGNCRDESKVIVYLRGVNSADDDQADSDADAADDSQSGE